MEFIISDSDVSCQDSRLAEQLSVFEFRFRKKWPPKFATPPLRLGSPSANLSESRLGGFLL